MFIMDLCTDERFRFWGLVSVGLETVMSVEGTFRHLCAWQYGHIWGNVQKCQFLERKKFKFSFFMCFLIICPIVWVVQGNNRMRRVCVAAISNPPKLSKSTPSLLSRILECDNAKSTCEISGKIFLHGTKISCIAVFRGSSRQFQARLRSAGMTGAPFKQV